MLTTFTRARHRVNTLIQLLTLFFAIAAGPAGGSGLLNLEKLPDAGVAHGWLHAHGVILFESMHGEMMFRRTD